MPANPRISAAFIDKISALCAAADASPAGIVVETGSKSEALKLRQNVYSARKALHKQNPNDRSPLSTVEMRIKCIEGTKHVLEIYPQGGLLEKFAIKDIATGEACKIEIEAEHNFEPSEDQIFDMELKLATERGPGEYRDEAIALLKAGRA